MRLRSWLVLTSLMISCAHVPPAHDTIPEPVSVAPVPPALHDVRVAIRGDAQMGPFLRMLQRACSQAGFLVVDNASVEHDLTVSVSGDGHSESGIDEQGSSFANLNYEASATLALSGIIVDEVKASASAKIVGGERMAERTQTAVNRAQERIAAELVNDLVSSAKLQDLAGRARSPQVTESL